jgi:tetratricopeptide (TPR) repeat protein
MEFRRNVLQPSVGLPDLETALDVAERGLGPEHPDCAVAKLSLAIRHAQALRFPLAERLVREAMETLANDVGDNRERRGQALLAAARLRTMLGQAPEAVSAAAAAFEIFDGRDGRRPQQIQALQTLGIARFNAGDGDGADEALSRANDLAKTLAGTAAVDWVSLNHAWGGANMLRHDYESALDKFVTAKDWLEDKHGVAHIELAIAYTHVGDALLVLQRCSEAIAAYNRALRIRVELEVEPDDHMLRGVIGKAICDAQLGDADAAKDGLRRVAELYAKGLDPYQVFEHWASMTTAELQWREGDRAAAREVAEVAAAGYRERGPLFTIYVVVIEDWLRAHPL